jgi:hypothetical protein
MVAVRQFAAIADREQQVNDVGISGGDAAQ